MNKGFPSQESPLLSRIWPVNTAKNRGFSVLTFFLKEFTFALHQNRFPMKLNNSISQPVWKIAMKISAVGFSLVLVTYGLVWVLLSLMHLVVDGLLPA
jgi:hypothetical protein